MLGLLGLFNHLTIYPFITIALAIEFKINQPFFYIYSKRLYHLIKEQAETLAEEFHILQFFCFESIN